MDVSMFLGPSVSGPGDDAGAIALCVEQALIADAAGFAAIYSGEQHFNDYEPYSNPIVMASYLAGQLQQAYLGTSMIPLVLHHPLLLVERMNLLDQLTHGRCIFGVSRGRPVKDPAFPLPELPGGQSELFERKLDVMLRAWAHRAGDGPLEFDTGAEQGAMPNRMMPVSFRENGPLLAIGTNTPASIREAGRLGRLVHSAGSSPAHARSLLDAYREGMAAGGIAPEVAAFNERWFIHLKVILVADTDEEAARLAEPLLRTRMTPPFVFTPPEQQGMTLAELLRVPPPAEPELPGRPQTLASFTQSTTIIGGPETVATRLLEFEDLGLSHAHLRFVFGALDDLDVFRRSLDLFVTEVLPRVHVERMPDRIAEPALR